MEVKLPEVVALAEEVAALRSEIAELREQVQPSKTWFNRKDLAALKNCKMSSFYSKPWLLPAEGQRIAGVEQWHRRDVLPWLEQSDGDLGAKPVAYRPVTESKTTRMKKKDCTTAAPKG